MYNLILCLKHDIMQILLNLKLVIQIILVMFITGVLLGFVGAGGSGFIISILTIIFHSGYLNIHLLIEVVMGTMIVSYIGAKFTRRVPMPILKTAMILVPVTAATLLLF